MISKNILVDISALGAQCWLLTRMRSFHRNVDQHYLETLKHLASLDKPAILTIRVLWFLVFLFVKSDLKKQILSRPVTCRDTPCSHLEMSLRVSFHSHVHVKFVYMYLQRKNIFDSCLCSRLHK